MATPPFGPAYMDDPRNKPWRYGRFDNGKPAVYRMPFMPTGSVSLTPFAHRAKGRPTRRSRGDKNSPAVGKFTHPSAAPDNHLLTVYSPGPVNHQYTFLPQLDGGIYLIKKGEVDQRAGADAAHQERPQVQRMLAAGRRAVQAHLRHRRAETAADSPTTASSRSICPKERRSAWSARPASTSARAIPTAPSPTGNVTATLVRRQQRSVEGLDAFTSHGNGMPLNWHNQGADAGLYRTRDIHAVRILAMEPTTDRNAARTAAAASTATPSERLRILGEIPVAQVRRADGQRGGQPLDPDGNPDTSFLAKIPADIASRSRRSTSDGMVLNMAQTWHQLRPGEIRNDCGGCHAHSQKPTTFKHTAAAKPDYKVWDLIHSTPLVTDKSKDESQEAMGCRQTTAGLRFAKSAVSTSNTSATCSRSCRRAAQPATLARKARSRPASSISMPTTNGSRPSNYGKFPGTYYRLAMDERAKFGYKPVGWDSWGYPNASRYIRKFQSRRSLLVWKIFGDRLDGFRNDDHPSETKPGSGKLAFHGRGSRCQQVQIGRGPRLLSASRCRHPAREAGSQAADRRGSPHASSAGSISAVRSIWTTIRPIPISRGFGWMLDDQRPTLTLDASATRQERGVVAHPDRHDRLRQRPRPGSLPR